MGFTPSQRIFYDSVINSPPKGVITLNAPAGTGKSFCIGEIFKYLKKCNRGILIIAPTHKACEVINKTLNTQICQTVHRFLHAELQIDEITGDQSFELSNSEVENQVILIDESSMIDSKMYDKFIRLSINNLIVFIGDAYQLPPVGEQFSKVFLAEDQITFKKNYRSNKDSEFFPYLKKFRNGVLNKTPTKISNSEKVNFNFIKKFFKDDEKDPIILAWTNTKVKYWNDAVRNYLFNDSNDDSDEDLDKYYVGEKLIFSGYRKDFSREAGKDKIYYSSDIITITSISKENKTILYPTCIHNTEEKTEVLDRSRMTYIADSTIETDINQKRIKCDNCGIKPHKKCGINIEMYKIIDQNGIVWYKSCKDDSSDIKSIIKEYKDTAIQLKNSKTWAIYYTFKNTYDPEINYSYASTTHKAQGSQYKNVFVDLGNIRFNRDIEINTKLAYTAVSRMRETVHFIQ